MHTLKDIHDDIVTSVRVSNDGKYLLSNGKDHVLKYIDIRTFKEVHRLENELYTNGSNHNRACLSSDGCYALVGSNNGSLLIFDV